MCNVSVDVQKGGEQLARLIHQKLVKLFLSWPFSKGYLEEFLYVSKLYPKSAIKSLGAQVKVLNQGRFLLRFRIWKQDYRYVGIDERGMLGLILKKFSGYFCCYSGHCKGYCGVSCSSVAAQITEQFQKWQGKQHSTFLLLLKSMVLSNCCYLGEEWLQFSRSWSNLLIAILSSLTQQLLLSDKDMPLDL